MSRPSLPLSLSSPVLFFSFSLSFPEVADPSCRSQCGACSPTIPRKLRVISWTRKFRSKRPRQSISICSSAKRQNSQFLANVLLLKASQQKLKKKCAVFVGFFCRYKVLNEGPRSNDQYQSQRWPCWSLFHLSSVSVARGAKTNHLCMENVLIPIDLPTVD